MGIWSLDTVPARRGAWMQEATHLELCPLFCSAKRSWCWKGQGAGGEGDDRGWDGWMASPTRWTWVCVNSRSWWWTGRPGMLRFMGSQRVGHDWVTELNWTLFIGTLSLLRGFPGGSDSKESACNRRDMGLIPGSGRSLRGGHGYPFQYSCLENSMDRGAWRATVHRVANSQTRQQLSLSLCPYETKITTSIHAPCIEPKWEEKVNVMGHLSSILLGQKQSICRILMQRLLLTHHHLGLVHGAMSGQEGGREAGHITGWNRPHFKGWGTLDGLGPSFFP